MNLGKYLEAIRTFDKAIVINPNDNEARQQRDRALKEDHGVVHIHRAFLKEPEDIDQVILGMYSTNIEQGDKGTGERDAPYRKRCSSQDITVRETTNLNSFLFKSK